jgi:muramidase (phage lysozyme)
MAILSDSLRSSNLNLIGISNSLSSSQKTISTANSTVERLSRNIQSNTRIKKELIDRSSIIRSRRDEASRRQELEDQLESSKVSTDTRSGLSFASKSELNPFGRLLGFLGFITAGWIMDNLPTWIFMGTEFIDRARRLGSYLPNMLSNLISISQSFTSVLSNSLTSILRLDFDEFSEGSVAKSFEGLQLSIENLGTNITDTFKLFTTPLTQSLETGEQAPDLGEMREDTTQPQYPQDQQTGGYGTKEQQALLKTIRFAEGTTSSYGVISGGDVVKELAEGKLTVQETINLAQTSKLPTRFGGRKVNHVYSGATGAYQFMPSTLRGIVSAGVLKSDELFTPQKQDEAALYLASRRNVTSEVLKKEGFSQRVSDLLAPEWASLPYSPKGGKSYYGQSYKPYGSVKSVYQSSLSSAPTQQPLNPVSGKGGKIIEYLTGDRKHKRYRADHAAGNYHDHVAFDSKETRDAAIKWLRSKGWVVGSINTGRHSEGSFHYSNQAFDIPFYPNQSKKGVTDDAKGESILSSRFRADLIAGGFNGPQLGESSIPAQISAPPKPSQPTQITPERRGSQVTIIDDSQPVQQPQVPYISQQPTVTPTVHESKLLNNFIKNKLLLDLAYL